MDSRLRRSPDYSATTIGDDAVDAADYSIWRDSLGQNVTPGSGADGSLNGVVDDADFDGRGKQHFGANTTPCDRTSIGSSIARYSGARRHSRPMVDHRCCRYLAMFRRTAVS